MTFSALSYIVWYRKYKSGIKSFVQVSQYDTAKTRLEELIAEHETNFPVNDHSTRNSELLQMRHALLHLDAVIESENQVQIDKVNRILDQDAESIS